MQPITLLVPDALPLDDADLLDLQRAVLERCGVSVAPARVASAELIPEILAPDAIAWAPPWIAFLLDSLSLGTPLLGVARHTDRPRSSVIVASAGVDGLPALSGSRMGWVSRRSVSGFLLPRLYLESFGVEVDSLFATQRFCGSHEAAAEALAAGSVDAIATDSRRLAVLLQRTRARVLASIGPLPSDVVVAGCGVPLEVRERLVCGAHGLSMGGVRFVRARQGHLEIFRLLGRDALRSSQGANGARGPGLVSTVAR